MERNRWGPRRYDRALINLHLDRQRDVPEGFVKLDTGDVVPVGADADGEDDECE